MSAAARRYGHLLATHAPPGNQPLRTSLRRRVLPGLALYLTLCQESVDREAVLEEIESAFRNSLFTHRVVGIRLLSILPDPFPLVRISLRRMTKDEYLPDAQVVVEDSSECFAVNTFRCFIPDALTGYGALELATVFCKTDD